MAPLCFLHHQGLRWGADDSQPTLSVPLQQKQHSLTFSLLTVAQGASLTTKPLDGALDSSWEEGFIYTCIASLSTTSASCSQKAQLGGWILMVLQTAVIPSSKLSHILLQPV